MEDYPGPKKRSREIIICAGQGVVTL